MVCWTAESRFLSLPYLSEVLSALVILHRDQAQSLPLKHSNSDLGCLLFLALNWKSLKIMIMNYRHTKGLRRISKKKGLVYEGFYIPRRHLKWHPEKRALSVASSEHPRPQVGRASFFHLSRKHKAKAINLNNFNISL